jgi:hypothetical protein
MQTCPGSGSCNCKFNNVESLRAIVRSEVETQVEQEVVRRLPNMSSKCSLCTITYTVTVTPLLLYIEPYNIHIIYIIIYQD